LIPILENAFKYSGLGISDPAFVKFKVTEADNRLQLICENSIMPDYVRDQTGGIGLNNIRKRLEMGYASNYEFDIHETAVMFILKLTLPLL
jgi:LytS/YehU family sensor histidine kinase